MTTRWPRDRPSPPSFTVLTEKFVLGPRKRHGRLVEAGLPRAVRLVAGVWFLAVMFASSILRAEEGGLTSALPQDGPELKSTLVLRSIYNPDERRRPRPPGNGVVSANFQVERKPVREARLSEKRATDPNGAEEVYTPPRLPGLPPDGFPKSPERLPQSVDPGPRESDRVGLPDSGSTGPSQPPVGIEDMPVAKLPDLYSQLKLDSPCEPLSMAGAVETALRYNPRLRETLARIDTAASERKIAFAGFLPVATASSTLVASSDPLLSINTGDIPSTLGGGAADRFNLAELQAGWKIWDFGRTLGTFRSADIAVQIARLQYLRARQTIAFDVEQGYYRVLEDAARVEVAADAIQRAREYLRVAKNRYDTGEADSEVVLSAHLEVTRAQERMVTAQTARRVAIADLNKTMGVDVAVPRNLIDNRSLPQVVMTLPDAFGAAFSMRYEITQANDWIAKANEKRNVAKSEFNPELLTGGSYSSLSGEGATSDMWVGGVRMQWDIYSGGKRIGELRKADAYIAEMEAKRKGVCDSVAFEVEYAYEHLQAAQYQTKLAKSAVVVARERFRIIMDKFAVGEASPTDVVTAQTELTTAEQHFYSSLYAVHKAISRLEYAIGVDVGGAE